MSMNIIYHNRDMDGFASAAICRLAFPAATLIGWDYSEPLPDLEQFIGQDVIMVDVTFPIDKMLTLGDISNLTLIDHHKSFREELDTYDSSYKFKYIYDEHLAGCELAWLCLFPKLPIPYPITLIGRYDTFRQNKGDWDNETLPFKFYCYSKTNSVYNFPNWFFFVQDKTQLLQECIDKGVDIMEYENKLNETNVKNNSFEAAVFGGYLALCINYYPFNSNVLKSKWNSKKYDLMIGFNYTGFGWNVSLRSEGDFDVSEIAKYRGGGGHKNAAGFYSKTFEGIFV